MIEQRRDLFDLMLRRVKETADEQGEKMPQAFSRWFSEMYFGQHIELYVSDGGGDGKADAFVSIKKGKSIRYKVINSKFTSDYNRASPVAFYDEITRFWQAFANKENRGNYLSAVRKQLHHKFKEAFRRYDEDLVDLYFITNHKVNQNQYAAVKSFGVEILHIDDILQYLILHLENLLPETDPLTLCGITSVLTPHKNETAIPTCIVFARLLDFIRYMEDDPFDLLFARNVRLWLGKTQTNRDIADTFKSRPEEFAYSNNGITIICSKQNFDVGTKELVLNNPRVVNGSQTLHSIRNTDQPSPNARVMVRIIQLPSENSSNYLELSSQRRDIVHKISVRSNMQNPIKRWNLVSNDDYQNEISQFFWKKKLFYERRQYEWKERRDDLKSIGISQGPEIRRLSQLIASYYYDINALGPAIAQGQLNALFDENEYSIIRKTSLETVYRIYLLSELVYRSLYRLKYKKRYIEDVSSYIKFSLFSVICRTIKRIDSLAWQKAAFEELLESELSSPHRNWDKLVKLAIDYILFYYKRARAQAKKENWELTPANFFKTKSNIEKIIISPIPRNISVLVKEIFFKS